MTLEEQLYARLTSESALNSYLATFGGKPAVFERQAPPDTDRGWSAAQYPRIDYTVDWSEDPERKTQGTLEINTWCLLTTSTPPESVERRIRDVLDGSIFKPAIEPITAFKWRASNPFEAGNEKQGLVIGITLMFDLLSFPTQTTYEPDPIAALQAWTSAKLPGLQADPESWAPTDANPAVYFRLSNLTAADFKPSVTWMDAVINIHVLAPTPGGRIPWIKQITEQIAQDRQTNLLDGSPVFFRTIAADSTADQLRVGQIRLTVRYGVLRSRDETQILNHAYL
jgi:hypothetical protein